MSTPTEDPPPSLPVIITVAELAELLRIGRNEAYALVQKGEVPGVRRIGKSIRIDRDSVLAWMKSGQGSARSRRSR